MSPDPKKLRKERGGFLVGDTVWTPLRRKAALLRFRPEDGYWSARYLGESAYAGGVILQPKLITLVEE